MDATDITNAIKNTDNDFRDRIDRWDKDFDRWDLKNPKDKGSFEYMTSVKSRDTDIDIVSNAPRTFSDDVQAILSSSERQIIARMAEPAGEDMREAIGKFERLLEYAFEKADERLIRLLFPTLKESSVWYSLVRGWVAGRFLIYKIGKDVIFDFLSLDPRWLRYRVGANGLLWTAYTTSYSSEALIDEYGDAGEKAISISGWKVWEKQPKTVDVIDYWKDMGNGKKMNAIICNNEWLKEPETYVMKSMPVLIHPVSTRPPVRGSTGSEMEGYGDSIFAPNREIDDLLNDMGSVWASHAKRLAEQPIVNYKGENGVEIKDTLHYAGGVINLPMNQNKLEPVPMKEISPTLVNLVNWLDNMRVRGSLPDINVGSPPPSGTLYNLVQETSNRVFNPQLRNLNSFYSNACRLIEEQLLEGGVGGEKIGKFKIRGTRKNEYFETEITPIDLKRPHIIKVEFTARTPWTQLDTYQIADMAKRLGLPDSFIHEYILKLPDPKGLGDQSAIEMAEHSPKLAMLRAIQALMQTGRQDEAESLMEDMYKMTMQEEANTGGANGMEQPPPISSGATGEAERAVSLPTQ